MTPAYVVQITTPKNYILNGLWFGPKRPKRVVVWVHGLTSSVFSMQHTIKSIVDSQTAVLAFNNRGHDIVSKLYPANRKRKSVLAGGAHEHFTDCVDDIQGAINLVRRNGIKNIYLAGHSTGCQKSIYWATKKGHGVRGIILLAPVSDYSAALKSDRKGNLARAIAAAKQLVRSGKPHSLLPARFMTRWSADDAQRFLSLYTPDSPETIFSYEQPLKIPRALKATKQPLLVLWAQKDEYADRPAKKIAAWFEKNLKNKHRVVIVPKVGHSFRGAEKRVAKEIATFMKEA